MTNHSTCTCYTPETKYLFPSIKINLNPTCNYSTILRSRVVILAFEIRLEKVTSNWPLVLKSGPPSRRHGIGHGNKSCFNRKLISRDVVSPPSLNKIHHILKTFQPFPTIIAIGVSFPFDKKLGLPIPFVVVQHLLNLPFRHLFNQYGCGFGLSPSRESAFIVGEDLLNHPTVENCLLR